MVMLGVNEIFEQPQGIYVCYMPKAAQGSSQTVESASELGWASTWITIVIAWLKLREQKGRNKTKSLWHMVDAVPTQRVAGTG